ncbi:MAG: hypothetical protein E3J35_08815 [Methanomassiliicoccales archaeon]|nr:MAG: hypothetical protein E3J35_08815 [Methanomassiliicoccales archaeon]
MTSSVPRAGTIKKAKGTFDIISYLYRHQEACITELIRNVDVCQKTIYRAIDILLSLDLISEEEMTTFPWRKIYTLTSKGQLLAEAPLYKSDSILNSFRPISRKNSPKREF